MRFSSRQVIGIAIAILIATALILVLTSQSRNASGNLATLQQGTLEPTDSIDRVPVSTANAINATGKARESYALTLIPPVRRPPSYNPIDVLSGIPVSTITALDATNNAVIMKAHTINPPRRAP